MLYNTPHFRVPHVPLTSFLMRGSNGVQYLAIPSFVTPILQHPMPLALPRSFRLVSTSLHCMLTSSTALERTTQTLHHLTPTTARTMSHNAITKRITGKTILITGASSGIGRSTAFEFARTAPSDLRLILTARRIDTLQKVAADITAEVGPGVKIHSVKLDVANPEEVRNLIPSLPAEFQDVDVLVNNAGMVKGVAKAPEIEEADIGQMFATNVHGLINMTQAVLKVYKKRMGPDGVTKGTGDIINIGSIAGREGYPGGSIYCSTKAAIRTFTEALRKELIDTRIRVMEIDPGQVETEFSIIRFGGDKAKADAVYA